METAISIGITIALLLGSSSCATIQKTFGLITPEERAQMRADAAARERLEQEHEEAKANIRPGASEFDIRQLWGDPDSVEYIGGHPVWVYLYESPPLYFKFKEGRMTDMLYDHEAAARAAQRNTGSQTTIIWNAAPQPRQPIGIPYRSDYRGVKINGY